MSYPESAQFDVEVVDVSALDDGDIGTELFTDPVRSAALVELAGRFEVAYALQREPEAVK